MTPIAFVSLSSSRAGLAIALLASLGLAACSSTPTRRGDSSARAAPADHGPPTASSASRKGGGYYLDDGPGDNPPPDLELLPDAVPRIEKYASGANRPYNVFGVDYVPDLSGAPYRQRGVGSWYGRKFHGQRTSNGEIYDMYAMTAAHPTLPIPCYALVTNLQNGRSVIVRVNDRGPFLHNRVMDLSYAAAYKLGYMSSGSGMIEVEMLMPADIAAGRIPMTTTGLLASASGAALSVALRAPSPVAAPPRPAVEPAAVTSNASPLTIEALIASRDDVRAPDERGSATPSTGSFVPPSESAQAAGLPPAPTIAPDALARSLPLSSPPTSSPSSFHPDASGAVDLVALPDRQLPAALPEVATSAGFYLQLGAFRVKSGADSFASHLAREIDPAIASRVQVSDANGLYRVRVGPYAQRGDADSAAAHLRAVISQPVLVLPGTVR